MTQQGTSMPPPQRRVVSHPDQGGVTAKIDLAASPERVFDALASTEVTDWWVRPGVFDTREWAGDVRPGGKWTASGIGARGPYGLEGEFVDVDPPHNLNHTWHLVGTPGEPTLVSYRLEPIRGGTRLTFRHDGMTSPEAMAANGDGWETSFARLIEILGEP